MRRLWIVLIACILFGTLGARAALAENVVVGVNVVGPDRLNEQQQDALLKELTDNGPADIAVGPATGFGCPVPGRGGQNRLLCHRA
jgi:hypothetical protein